MSDARKKILKLLSEGKITLEEAEELLDTIQQQEKKQDSKPHPSEESSAKVYFQNIKTGLSDFVDNIKTNLYEKIKKTDINTSEIKQKIKDLGGWVNSFVAGVFSELSKGNYELSDGVIIDINIPQNETFEKVEKVSIDSSFGSITIKESNTFLIKVKGKISKGILNEQPIHEWFSNNAIKVENGKLSISLDPAIANKVILELELNLPATTYISCKTVSAPISIWGNFRVEFMKVVNADVKLFDCNLQNFKIESVNGDLNIDHCMIENLEFISTSGNCRIINSKLDKVFLQSISGNIEISSCEVYEYSVIKINTTTGNIIVSKIEGPWSSVKAYTRNGEMNVLWIGDVDKSNTFGIHIVGKSQGASFYAESVGGDISFV